MRIAFKEWAIVVDALGRGEQILILRKGGLREGRGGFALEHPQFLLFPTLFHQQRESVAAPAQARFDKIIRRFPTPDTVRIEFFCDVAAWQRVDSLAAAGRLRGQHIWREEVIAGRFDRGKDKRIQALAVRVFRLAQAVQVPMLDRYGGCKSWIELVQEIATDGAAPVLTDAEFNRKLDAFRSALEMGVTAATDERTVGTSE